MNDPWDVKSVRQSGQYVSCMKINGIPLLPPVLSKECRSEMQYYKLLAKEVEKRIAFLQTFSVSDTDEDKTDAPELSEYEQGAETNINEEQLGKTFDKSSNGKLKVSEKVQQQNVISEEIILDLDLQINNPPKTSSGTSKDLPERDCDCLNKTVLIDAESRDKSQPHIDDLLNFSFNINSKLFNNSPYVDINLNQDGPSSLSSKSFTGSLIDIHTESKGTEKTSKLIRQRSYTVLKPSPQLLAHLEIQSQNTGLDISAISMSESLSNLSFSPKKRRSWDLETAKEKWSSMALDLNKKNKNVRPPPKSNVDKQAIKKPAQTPNSKARSLSTDKNRRTSITSKPNGIKSEPIQKPAPRKSSPVRNTSVNPQNKTLIKESTFSVPKKNQVASPTNSVKSPQSSPKHASPSSSPPAEVPLTSTPTKTLISRSEDPATRVRELYERIQKQQLMQMANLIEKQKKEQLLLQQLFEEQNNLLYKQLKTICPKTSIEIKQAWKENEAQQENRGPVSLSQLINEAPNKTEAVLPPTLTDTNNYINQCEDAIKKSRNIMECLKKYPNGSQQNQEVKAATPSQMNGTSNKSTPRRQIKYDSSTEREYAPLLSDRTNDTMADLNVTFSTDDDVICDPFPSIDNTVVDEACGNITVIHKSNNVTYNSYDDKVPRVQSTNGTKSCCVRKPSNSFLKCPPTPEERRAATKIVAYAKGFLVRRLMRTERVQSTVQTIRDALLCALQLHQDREGIRGADVDLHRRLIQQITAACYSLHDTFVGSAPAERCSLIAADRARLRALAARLTPPPHMRQPRHTDVMSKSYSGSFPPRASRSSLSSKMSQSNYETFSELRPNRRPWR